MIHNTNRAAKGGIIARLLALGFVAFAAFGTSAETATTSATNGGGFGDFYRQAQLQLFSSLDDALSQEAEDALLDEFSAIRKADINLQTELGGRKAHLGVNLIGAFLAEDHHAAGWQLRVYAGEEDSKGANAGGFYRRIRGNALYGFNLFADYEDGNHGNFLRYSIGGEVQNTIFALNANYYIPETEGRGIANNERAFSRRGYDMQLRVNVRRLNFLKVRADYYNFDGKEATSEGGGYSRSAVEADEGFRYGVEFGLPPFDGLHVALLYDSGGEKFGGDLTYTHIIGAPSFNHGDTDNNAAAEFAPDLFSAVSREYSQRIAIQPAPRALNSDKDDNE